MREEKVILKRILVVFIGVYLLGLGIAIEIKANLGINALTLFCEGLGKQINMSVGNASILLLVVIALILFFIDKKRVGIGTLMNGILVGLFIDLHCNVFSFFTLNNMFVRILFMIIGIMITAIGIGMYVSADLGESGADAVMILLANYLDKNVKYVRMAIDLLLIIFGVVMGGSVGISTFVSMLLYGIVIDKTLSVIHNKKTKLGECV